MPDYPEVEIEEMGFGPKPIVGVTTNVTAFLGEAEQGGRAIGGHRDRTEMELFAHISNTSRTIPSARAHARARLGQEGGKILLWENTWLVTVLGGC